jgi:hypothetical protein
MSNGPAEHDCKAWVAPDGSSGGCQLCAEERETYLWEEADLQDEENRLEKGEQKQ